jgi:anti-sigma factor (TIGR02949 family)
MSAKQSLTCEEVLKHLFAYIDKELDVATSAEIDRHLEQCRGCFSRADFERKLKDKLAESGSIEAPERVRSRVKALIDKF